MTSILLFSAAFLFELASWASLFGELTEGQAALLFVVCHGLGSLLLAGGTGARLYRRYPGAGGWSLVLPFCLAFCIPLVGPLGLLLSVVPALYRPRQRKPRPWRALGVPALPFRPPGQTQKLMFSDGGLQDVLRHSPDPDQRLTALVATRRMRGKDAIPVLKLALRDPSDEVRLLAYSMLDQRESRINQRIEATLAKLAEAAPSQRGELFGTLARWYWELAYLGLAQGSVLDHVLDQAGQYVEQALANGGGFALRLLAGRIALAQGRLDRAEEQLLLAERAGIAAERLLPFRAELAFSQRRYQEIPGLLARLPAEMLQRPPFAALARYWL